MDSSPRAIATSGPHRISSPAHRLSYLRRLNLLSLVAALPGMLASGVLVWLMPWDPRTRLLLLAAEVLVWWLLALVVRENIRRPLQTLANVVSALREEDYSFRARGARLGDPLGELSLEINALADMLAEHRVRVIEATALLRRVVEEVDVPLFAFDPGGILRLVNSAGERLLQQPAVKLLGRTVGDLGLEGCLTAVDGSLVSLPFGGAGARWAVRRSTFRQDGVPHTLVVLSDVSRVLREEERSAWQRLIRVLGHELNNSLAPIKSIAASLSDRIAGLELQPEESQDFKRGLDIIGSRAASLHRFLQAYRQLAQMPPPNLRESSLSPIVNRVAALELRTPVGVITGPEIALRIDPDQIEQMLINLVRNAVDAVLDGNSRNIAGPAVPAPGASSRQEVVIRWEVRDREVVLTVEDNGPGLLNPSNTFVPFYTTKPAGSGVGLVLCRQIAEVHGGTIELANRSDCRGCVARVALPR